MKKLSFFILWGFVLAQLLSTAPSWAQDESSPPSEQQEDDWGDDDWAEEDPKGLQWHGFLEGESGMRINNDPVLPGKDLTLADLRLRLETKYTKGTSTIQFKGDGWYDQTDEKLKANIRDLTLSLPLSDTMDLKVGRQILTWGTGDFLFINDQFSKNWQAFFSGQDDEYLKVASDSLKLSYYKNTMNVDLVWTPVFQSDTYINGDLFSFFSPEVGQNIAPHFKAVQPNKALDNGELAVRVKFQSGSAEYAFYGYKGYTGTPVAISPMGQPTFAKSQTLGSSFIKPLGKGLVKAEIGYHYTHDKQNQTFIKKQVKALVGYEQEVAKNLTLSGQYLMEYIPNHDRLSQTMIAAGINGDFVPDSLRHVLTLRTNYTTNRSNTVWSLFVFYSPSDKDGYMRPKVSHRVNDNFSINLGANLFFGKRAHSFFGQFENASNGYIRFRYGF